MRYAKIDECENCNGVWNGISLFIQGCHFQCHGCFNQETWDFNGGQEWTEETEKEFLELANRPYIKRISILGGEPLEENNLDSVLKLLQKIRSLFGNTKTVWLYTGYTFEEILNYEEQCDTSDDYGHCIMMTNYEYEKRKEIIELCDVLVDGRFEVDKIDLSLPFRGSTNQRLIGVKKSIKNREIVLWEGVLVEKD